MLPGEYPQPLARIAPLNFTAINGYTTLRLRNLAVPILAAEASKSTLVCQNVGDQTVTLQLRGAANVSGSRTNLGSPVTIVPGGGFKQVSFQPTQPILEVACTSGTSTVRSTMESLLNWEVMAVTDTLWDGTTNPLFPPSFNKSPDVLPWASL
jgi:hypothetical protein